MKQQNDFNTPKNGSTKWYVWLFIALLGALLLSNMAGETIKNMFFSLLGGIAPILGAVILAFILLNPIKWIENKLLKNAFVGNPRASSYKRAISLTICYVVVIGFIVGLIWAFVPNLISTLTKLVETGDLETTLASLKENITTIIVNITGLEKTVIQDALSGFFTGLSEMVTEWWVWLQKNITNVAGIIGNALFVIGMSLLLSFLMLKDKDRIAKLGRRFTYAYKPKHKADEIILTTHRTQKVLDQWLVCNLITMGIIFVCGWIGYGIIGVKFAGIMALLLAILSVVPYIGGFIAIVPVALVTLVFGTTTQFLAAVLFGILLWAIVVTFLPPIIMSNRLQTRALFLLLIMIIAGALFGVWGMILSGPIAAMLNIWFQEKLRVRETMREKEDLSQETNFSPGDLSDVLDLREDVDSTLLDTIEDEKEQISKRSKSKKKKEKEKN